MKPLRMNDSVFNEYISKLIDRTYKILPLYEQNNDKQQLSKYIKSLLFELYGTIECIVLLEENTEFLSYCATLESLAKEVMLKDNQSMIKSETFKAINLINKIKLSLPFNGGDKHE